MKIEIELKDVNYTGETKKVFSSVKKVIIEDSMQIIEASSISTFDLKNCKKITIIG